MTIKRQNKGSTTNASTGVELVRVKTVCVCVCCEDVFEDLCVCDCVREDGL